MKKIGEILNKPVVAGVSDNRLRENEVSAYRDSNGKIILKERINGVVRPISSSGPIQLYNLSFHYDVMHIEVEGTDVYLYAKDGVSLPYDDAFGEQFVEIGEYIDGISNKKIVYDDAREVKVLNQDSEVVSTLTLYDVTYEWEDMWLYCLSMHYQDGGPCDNYIYIDKDTKKIYLSVKIPQSEVSNVKLDNVMLTYSTGNSIEHLKFNEVENDDVTISKSEAEIDFKDGGDIATKLDWDLLRDSVKIGSVEFLLDLTDESRSEDADNGWDLFDLGETAENMTFILDDKTQLYYNDDLHSLQLPSDIKLGQHKLVVNTNIDRDSNVFDYPVINFEDKSSAELGCIKRIITNEYVDLHFGDCAQPITWICLGYHSGSSEGGPVPPNSDIYIDNQLVDDKEYLYYYDRWDWNNDKHYTIYTDNQDEVKRALNSNTYTDITFYTCDDAIGNEIGEYAKTNPNYIII